MITLDRDTRLEKVQDGELLCRDVNRMQLCSAPTSISTPWLVSALTHLWSLQKTGRAIAGVGDLRVTDETAWCVGRVLGSIKCQWLPSPEVMPVSGGGVALRWSVGSSELEVAVLPGDRVLATTFENGEMGDSYDLPGTDYVKVNELFRNLVA